MAQNEQRRSQPDASLPGATGPPLSRRRTTGGPDAGARSNVIVGFPGETEDDVAELARFLTAARLDAVGVFGYSDEDGTEAASLPGKLDPAEVRARVASIGQLVEELTAQRAEDRIGEQVEVLVEHAGAGAPVEGRGEHQGPDVDGTTTVLDAPGDVRVGELLTAEVVGCEGVDLRAAYRGGRR